MIVVNGLMFKSFLFTAVNCMMMLRYPVFWIYLVPKIVLEMNHFQRYVSLTHIFENYLHFIKYNI